MCGQYPSASAPPRSGRLRVGQKKSPGGWFVTARLTRYDG